MPSRRAKRLISRVTVFDSRLEAAAQSERLSRSGLLEAIESISEAFCLHDRDDRLVLCTARGAPTDPPEVDPAR